MSKIIKRLTGLFICAISITGFSQSHYQNSIDSILHISRTIEKDQNSVDQLNALGQDLFSLGMRSHKDSLYAYLQNVIQISRSLDYKAGLAEALYNSGRFNVSGKNDYPKATPNFLESLALYEDMEDDMGIAKCYMQLGLISFLLQYYEDAIKNFKLSLQYDDILTSTYLMALSFSELDNFSEAKKYFTLSIEEYKKVKRPFRLNECYMYLGKLYEKENKLDSAFYFINMSIENITDQDRTADLVRPHALLSGVYLKLNKIDRAIHFAESAYIVAKEGTDVISQIESSKTLSEAYAIKKNYKRAHFYLEIYTTLNNKYVQGSTKQKVADMQSLFDFKKKINDEKIRSQKDKEIAEQTIQKEKILRNSFLVGSVLLLILLFVLFNRYNLKRRSALALKQKNVIISEEKRRSDDLLLNILPEQIAEELKINGKAEAQNFEKASIIFTDFISFTETASKLSAGELVSEINICFEAFDHILDKYDIEKIKTIGDAYMAAGGIPVPSENSVKNSVLASLDMQKFISKRKIENDAKGETAFEMRLGINTGPIIAGIVGVKKFQYDIWGDAVNTASRLESKGQAGKVNISQSTYELLKNDACFKFESRGKIAVKGKGEIEMWFVEYNNGAYTSA